MTAAAGVSRDIRADIRADHASPAVRAAQTTAQLDDGRTVPLVTIPLYALLKIVAYSDRREA